MIVFQKNEAARQARHSAAVNAERSRRIEDGAPFTVTGYADPIHLQGREEDKINLTNLAMAAQLRLSINPATTEMTVFRDRLNVNHTLTQSQVLELWQKGAEWITSLYQVSWALKAQLVGSDGTDDAHWPDPS